MNPLLPCDSSRFHPGRLAPYLWPASAQPLLERYYELGEPLGLLAANRYREGAQ